MSDSPRVDDLENRIEKLESRVRLLAAGLVFATLGLGALIVAPGTVYVLFPTLVAFAIVALVLGSLQPSRRERSVN